MQVHKQVSPTTTISKWCTISRKQKQNPQTQPNNNHQRPTRNIQTQYQRCTLKQTTIKLPSMNSSSKIRKRLQEIPIKNPNAHNSNTTSTQLIHENKPTRKIGKNLTSSMLRSTQGGQTFPFYTNSKIPQHPQQKHASRPATKLNKKLLHKQSHPSTSSHNGKKKNNNNTISHMSSISKPKQTYTQLHLMSINQRRNLTSTSPNSKYRNTLSSMTSISNTKKANKHHDIQETHQRKSRPTIGDILTQNTSPGYSSSVNQRRNLISTSTKPK